MAIGSTWQDSSHSSVHVPALRRIHRDDLIAALRLGWQDFGAQRSDVMFLCLIYPAIGLVLARLAVGQGVLPVIFPLGAGFALLGPFAGVFLSYMSRRREAGLATSWRDALDVFRLPTGGAILLLGLGLGALFVVWLAVANLLWTSLFPDSIAATPGAFLHAVFATPEGWVLIVLGNAIGAMFALVALAVGVFSFPLLVDRTPGASVAEQLSVAVFTSLRATAENPRAVLGWGVIVAALLLAGSIPLFIGLVVVLPWLGHATWHLYRRTVE